MKNAPFLSIRIDIIEKSKSAFLFFNGNMMKSDKYVIFTSLY